MLVFKSIFNYEEKFEPEWMIFTDDESTLIYGDGQNWIGMNPENGKIIWKTTINDLKTSDEKNLQCFYSGQPWAPRHPIPMAGQKICL